MHMTLHKFQKGNFIPDEKFRKLTNWITQDSEKGNFGYSIS